MLDWHAMSNDILTAARLLAALLISVEAGAALAQPPARLVDAAGSEREVVWYTAMNTPDAAPLRKRFLEKYPDLNLTILRQPGEKIRTRILTEMRAGKFLWDVVSFNHLDMDALAQEGLLAAYASPETRSGFPGGAVDPEGRWAAIYVRQYVIGYNTGSVPGRGAPADWVKTLDPVITSPSQVAVSARAPHPNAGRLLVDLLLSAEGQALISDRGRVPARNDLARGPASVPLKLHYVNPQLAREADRHEKGFREIFLRGH